MKSKDLLALEVSASSSHLFSKNQKNAFFLRKKSHFFEDWAPKSEVTIGILNGVMRPFMG